MSGLFAKTIQLDALSIVWWRTGFAALVLFLAQQMFARLIIWPKTKKEFCRIAALGLVLALHWFAFFHSIQLSTVAIGVLTFASFPIFVIIGEALAFRARVTIRDLALALVVFVGVGLVVGPGRFSSDQFLGAVWGVISGVLYALLTVANKRLVESYSAITLGFFECLVAFGCLTPMAFRSVASVSSRDLIYLLLLGTLFTGFAHVVFVHGMRKITARLASLIGTLEPVYAVVAAIVLLGEVPGGTNHCGRLVNPVLCRYCQPDPESRNRPVDKRESIPSSQEWLQSARIACGRGQHDRCFVAKYTAGPYFSRRYALATPKVGDVGCCL